ncbi:MAG: hypothetical protein OEY07_20460 [Gammaproteobacteria bacterium]|nr:hypothetical protein [Gammaproteobacteria bacterium]
MTNQIDKETLAQILQPLFKTLTILEDQHKNLRHTMAGDPLPADRELIKLKHQADELRYEIEEL